MKAWNKINRILFVIALLVFALFGLITVILQLTGLIMGNGGLMMFADESVFPIAVLGSTIAGFLSFIFPYSVSKKEKNEDASSF